MHVVGSEQFPHSSGEDKVFKGGTMPDNTGHIFLSLSVFTLLSIFVALSLFVFIKFQSLPKRSIHPDYFFPTSSQLLCRES